MLHSKFRGNQSAGSGEDFCRVFTIYGHGGHLFFVMLINFMSMHLKAYIQNLIKKGPVVSEKSMF